MEIDNPRVLIVILNYGTYDLTIKLVNDIHSNLDYDNYSIIVVDNCSPNESAEVLHSKSLELNYIFISNDKNAGYAAGNNIGIRYGIKNKYDYSLIMNNDVVINNNSFLSHMVSIAEKQSNIGCVGPMIYSSNGSKCSPYCRRPNLWRMTLGTFYEKKYRNKYINKSMDVYRVYGCCMLLKNSVMSAVDCMDERTFLYSEEAILAERMLRKGFRCFYDSEVSIIHNESTTLKRMSSQSKKFRITETEKSREIYLRDYLNFSKPIRVICHLFWRIIYTIR